MSSLELSLEEGPSQEKMIDFFDRMVTRRLELRFRAWIVMND